MDSSVGVTPNFTGRVDKSVYKYTKTLTKALKEEAVRKANFNNKALTGADLEVYDKQADKVMQQLEAKAAQMHPNTVVTVDQPIGNDRFLSVHNDKLYTHMRQTPAAKKYEGGMFGDRLTQWQLSGSRTPGSPSTPTQHFDRFSSLVDNIDETKNDKHLARADVHDLVKDAEYGTDKKVMKHASDIQSFYNTSEMKPEYDYMKQFNEVRTKADDEEALRNANNNLIGKGQKTGFFSKIANFFS